jgi:hypothetical protein
LSIDESQLHCINVGALQFPSRERAEAKLRPARIGRHGNAKKEKAKKNGEFDLSGIFITTATYTKDALEFGAANPIQLLDGTAFTRKLKELSEERQDDLLRFAFEGDYRTPTYPSCGVKMIKREGKRGAFWGCAKYPKCKNMLSR